MERSITAEGMVEILDRLFTERGEPAYIRSDNGPKFIAEAIERWLATSGVKTLYIEPGALWENAYLRRLSSAGCGMSYWIGRCLPI
jgi:putative transposase